MLFSMEEMFEVYCRNTDSKILIPSGMDLLSVAKFAGLKNTDSIIAYIHPKQWNSSTYIPLPEGVFMRFL